MIDGDGRRNAARVSDFSKNVIEIYSHGLLFCAHMILQRQSYDVDSEINYRGLIIGSVRVFPERDTVSLQNSMDFERFENRTNLINGLGDEFG